MRYLLATSAISNPELLDKCVSSWPNINNVDTMVFLDNFNSSSPLQKYNTFEGLPYNFVYDTDHRGCSGAWNWLLLEAFWIRNVDALIVVGSDTEMKEGFLEGYIKEFEEKELDFAVGVGHVCWNCWCITRQGYEKVGTFDENLFPSYYEDNDYHTRVVRAGLKWDYIGDPELMFHYGSATIRLDDSYSTANNITFTINGDYYISKWGGTPGNEKYINPFNNPELTIKDWTLDEEKYNYKKKIWNKN